MNPNDCTTIAQFLIGNLELEIPTTARVFGAVPADALDYRPDGKSKTALALMRHITLEDEWFLNAIADGHFSPPPDESDACGILTPAEAAARYQERMSAALVRVRALSGEALAQPIDLLGAIQMPAIQFLSLLLRHSAHHRGQLSAYLRAMGGKVPPIYGPTADTEAVTE